MLLTISTNKGWCTLLNIISKMNCILKRSKPIVFCFLFACKTRCWTSLYTQSYMCVHTGFFSLYVEDTNVAFSDYLLFGRVDLSLTLWHIPHFHSQFYIQWCFCCLFVYFKFQIWISIKWNTRTTNQIQWNGLVNQEISLTHVYVYYD